MNNVDQAQPVATAEVQPEGVLPLLQLISVLIEKRCDRFLGSRYGLTMPQYQLLMAASRRQDMTLGGLSDELNCSRGNITGIVDRLERDEWLQRERSASDRRVITVRLTEKGRAITQIEKELSMELALLAQVWEDEQRELLTTALVRIYQELRD